MKNIEIKEIKQDKIFKKSQVVLVYLFGSTARGEAHKESDVDIAVLFNYKVDKDTYLKREGKLISFFSQIYPKKEINIVNLNISTPLLKQAVILDGIMLFQNNDLDRISFQMQTLFDYEDYIYLSNTYNHFLKEKIKAL